jgi:glycosyltransferase involved in cell wall biosynthesis
MVGDAVIIHRGIPLDLYKANGQKTPNSILILAKKNKNLGKRLYKELRERGLQVNLIRQFLPREEFVRRLAESEIFVALPFEREGFYVPPLEGMASRCAVICSDAVGNRGFCLHSQTCLMPDFNHYDSHLAMIEQLLENKELRERICRRGFEVAQNYSLENERIQFYRVLDEYIFT